MILHGDVTCTQTPTADGYRLTYRWVSDASGQVTHLGDEMFSGKVASVVTVPVGASANYDVTLLDSRGRDLLAGVGANRSDTAVETALPLFGAGPHAEVAFTAERLEFQIRNAGASKSGITDIYLRPPGAPVGIV